jgi:WD40 repeat protein
VPSCHEEISPVGGVENFNLPGVLAYYDANQIGFFATGGSPLENTQLPISGTISTNLVGFSPDGEWLAYTLISPTIGLLSSSGDVLEHVMDMEVLYSRIPDGAYLCGWEPRYGWINENLIPIAICYRLDAQSNRTNILFEILDPFLGLWREGMLSELPHIAEESRAQFSPDLSRVLYDNASYDLVLWDLTNNKSIDIDQPPFESDIFSNTYWPDLRSAWSYDSSMVAITGSEDKLAPLPDSGQRGVYLLGREGGKFRRITNFLQDFDTFQTYGLRWSHDSRYLAFGVTHSLGGDYRQTIYIYDTASNSYIFQCVLSQSDPVRLRWSPDNQFIAYTNSIVSPLVVINIRTGEIVELAERAIIGDWTDNLQWMTP